MHRNIFPILFLSCFVSIAQNQNYLFTGEKIRYSLRYEFIKAGELEVFVDTTITQIDDHYCYKAQIVGYTIGAVGLFAKIHNTYTSYIDTSELLSYKFIRQQQENNYTLYEKSEFDRKSNQCLVSRRKADNSFELKTYKIAKNVQDMVSTYFKLRNLDLDTVSKGKVVNVSLFFEDTTLTVGFKFLKKEKIRTNIGRLKTMVVSPFVPQTKNTILSKTDPIKAWITDDIYRIPVRIEVNTKWGSVEAEIIDYNLIKKKKRKFLFF